MPRHTGQPIDIASDNRCFGRHWRHHFQLLQFSLGFFFSLGWHFGFFDFIAQRFKLIRRVVELAQFFLNGFHLLVQIVLALRLLHLLLNAGANFLFDLQQINFAFH